MCKAGYESLTVTFGEITEITVKVRGITVCKNVVCLCRAYIKWRKCRNASKKYN